MEFKFTVEEVDTSSAFARSVPMARPNRMVVEVNDEDGSVFVARLRLDGSRFVNPIM